MPLIYSFVTETPTDFLTLRSRFDILQHDDGSLTLAIYQTAAASPSGSASWEMFNDITIPEHHVPGLIAALTD